MPGYVIHLAVAEEYIRNFNNEISNYDKFVNGVLFPDSVKDKSLTHFGEKSSKTHLNKYFEKYDLKDDFEKGYFLHLVTDYLFYNKFLKYMSNNIYDDYDKSNTYLINKFNVKIPEYIKDNVKYQNGKTELFTIDEITEFIINTSKYNLFEVKEKALNNEKFWNEIISLKHI